MKLCKLLGLENSDKDLLSHRKSRTHNPKTLKKLSSDVLSIKIPKVYLNIVWDEYIWPSKLSIWKVSSPVQDTVKVPVPGFLVLSSRIQWTTRSAWGKMHQFFSFSDKNAMELLRPWVDVALYSLARNKTYL